ncbi:uncharacterized protein [Choristoneura fumiferana]|uniref:uncharacterized protein n=1 Tax=Choristoneura fumiferana TaxID=7141 RepID=UPI003D1572E7
MLISAGSGPTPEFSPASCCAPWKMEPAPPAPAPISQPLNISPNEFIRRYRLSKELTLDLCEELRPLLKEPVRSTDLDLETKVLTTLSLYAVGSYQRPIGDIGAHSLAQQTVSSVVAQITACLNTPQMRRKYIVFPSTLEERNETRTLWTCDSGYPLRKYMMTPITNAAEDSPESHYTNIHVRARNVVERTLGVLKTRFRCISGHRVLNSPEVAGSIINACAILHNICNTANLPILDLGPLPRYHNRRLQQAATEPLLEDAVVIDETERSNPQLRLGTAIRNRLVRRLWEGR